MPTEPDETVLESAANWLDGFPVVIEVPVWWGDQDAFQHVNNTIYLRWFETARIAYTRGMGVSDMMAREQIGPILASISCDFRAPLTYPDTIRVGASVRRIGRTSLTMDHRVVSQKLGRIAAEGTSSLVLYDYKSARPHPIPEELRARIEALEGKPL